MAPHLATFAMYTLFPCKVPVKVANKECIQALGHGTVDLKVKQVKGKTDSLQLTDIWYVSDISHNLFSIGVL